jgi:hypothetical protein
MDPDDRSFSPSLSCENVRISGAAAKIAAMLFVDRPEVDLTGMRIVQTGESRDGLHFIRSNDAVLRDVEIDVRGKPFILEESQVHRINVQANSLSDNEQSGT